MSMKRSSAVLNRPSGSCAGGRRGLIGLPPRAVGDPERESEIAGFCDENAEILQTEIMTVAEKTHAPNRLGVVSGGRA